MSKQNKVNGEAAGIIDLPCNRSVAETAEQPEAMLKSKGMKIFVRISSGSFHQPVAIQSTALSPLGQTACQFFCGSGNPPVQ